MSPEWEEYFAEAKRRPILEVAERLGVKLKGGGRDYTGPCPAGCAETDGFVVTPSKGIFLCRPSGETGNVVDMVMHAKGLGSVDAVEWITGADKPGNARQATAAEREERAAARDQREAELAARRAEEAREADAKRLRDEEAIAKVLERCVPIWGTRVEEYFRVTRGLKPPKRLCGDLKYVADLDYWGRETGDQTTLVHLATLPAMVALIRDVNGTVIGIHQTYLDPQEPVKWVAPFERQTAKNDRLNPSKKIRGDKKRGLIRLGLIEEKLALGEGIETTLAWYSLGIGLEDISIACAVDLHNLAGKWTGTLDHPTRRNLKGKPTKFPNGLPDIGEPGAILPDSVREVYLLEDGDSETYATKGAIMTALRRYRAEGRQVYIHPAPAGLDWNDVVLRQQMEAKA